MYTRTRGDPKETELNFFALIYSHFKYKRSISFKVLSTCTNTLVYSFNPCVETLFKFIFCDA